MTLISYFDLHVGLELPAQEFVFTRVDLIKYAGASGDFNVIHWNERVATEVGLPSVIAHGMLTMGLAGKDVHQTYCVTSYDSQRNPHRHTDGGKCLQ